MEKQTRNTSKRMATASALTALALIFSYVEFLLPISIGIPGIKLGLANIVVLIALYTLGVKYAIAINAARIVLSALLFGNAFSVIYALAGGAISLFVMIVLRRTKKFSLIGVSMAGGVFHNIGQLAIAALVLQSAGILNYISVLVIAGIVTGIITGFIAAEILRILWKK